MGVVNSKMGVTTKISRAQSALCLPIRKFLRALLFDIRNTDHTLPNHNQLDHIVNIECSNDAPVPDDHPETVDLS